MSATHDKANRDARLTRAEPDKVNILLVDDQPARLLSYETILGQLGQNLITARSGVEALARLMKDEFALVLLDVSMPGMDGFETAEMIHDHPRFERTPIIFITGVHDTEFDRLKGYKLGAVDYVSIPVVPEILRSKVSVLVELHCQRLELQKLNRSLADANEQLEQANTTLQAEKTRELESLNLHLQQVNTELAASNQALQAEIAERARAEAALLEADRHKDEFLAILAHELRNPLAPIRNASAVFRHADNGNATLRLAGEIVDRQVAQLARLVDDLLDVSRITQGKVQLKQQVVQLQTLITQAVETAMPVIEAKHQHLSVRLPRQPLELDADPARLTQVVGNLLNNAAKYTPEGGHICIAVRRRGDIIVVRVRDNGVGIAPLMLGTVFDLFVQVDTTLDRSQGGLGIGLTLVRAIVELHGGGIRARSAGLGRGSRFLFWLPALAQDGAVATAERHGAERAGLRKRRLLLVDDNVDAVQSLAMLLAADGHDVRTAHDGVGALDLVQSFRPDVVVLDIGLPGMDGYEVAQRIRAGAHGAPPTLVALTGYGQQEDRQRAREAGFDHHFIKPADIAALQAAFTGMQPGDAASSR